MQKKKHMQKYEWTLTVTCVIQKSFSFQFSLLTNWVSVCVLFTVDMYIVHGWHISICWPINLYSNGYLTEHKKTMSILIIMFLLWTAAKQNKKNENNFHFFVFFISNPIDFTFNSFRLCWKMLESTSNLFIYGKHQQKNETVLLLLLRMLSFCSNFIFILRWV